MALPLPIRKNFTYRIPDGRTLPEPGVRVRVPFGERVLTGVVVADASGSGEASEAGLRDVLEVLDEEPVCPPEMIETKARLTMDQSNASWIITTIHLETQARVPGLDGDTFARVAEETKVSCPISKVLNATVTLDAELLV